MALQYFVENGNLNIKTDYIMDSGYNLGAWIYLQRKNYIKNKLSEEQIGKLNLIGMIWNVSSNYSRIKEILQSMGINYRKYMSNLKQYSIIEVEAKIKYLISIGIKEDEGFLVIGAEPLLYLYADTKVASYSTWQVFTNETRLYRYYEVHEGEGQFPTVVYCAEADETIFESIFVDKLLLPQGYEWKQMKKGIAFYTPR
jgi:hypothetical protein